MELQPYLDSYNSCAAIKNLSKSLGDMASMDGGCRNAQVDIAYQDQDQDEIAVENNILVNMVLFNDLILDVIFSHMPLEDLKSCRRVCSNWNDLIYKFLDKKAAVTFNLHCLHYARKVLNDIDSDAKLPCSTVRVINPVLRQRSVFNEIINKYGESIQELQIEPYKIGRVEYEYLNTVLNEQLPKLTSFSFGVPPKRSELISCGITHTEKSKVGFTKLKRIQCNIRSTPPSCSLMIDFLGNLIESSPELEEISGDNATFFNIVKKRLSPIGISNLKSITFDNHPKSGEGITSLIALSTKGLSLQKFVWKDNLKIPIINQLLEFLKTQTSLKKFSVYLSQSHILDNNSPLHFSWLPFMEKLTCFKIFSTNPIFFWEKNWMSQLPALKTFHYGTETNNAVSVLMNVIGLGICKPNLQLTSIQFLAPHGPNERALQCVARTLQVAFPNLKKFVYAYTTWDSHQHTKDYSSYLLPQNCGTKERYGVTEMKEWFGEELSNFVSFMQ